MSTSKKTKSQKSTRHLTLFQRIITIIFFIVFLITLIIVLCFSWLPYGRGQDLILPNIISLMISLAIGLLFMFLFKKLDISKKRFILIVAISFSVLYAVQLFILFFTYFKTGWDAGTVNMFADDVAKYGKFSYAGTNEYLTLYPNNTLIVTLLSLIKKIPFFGSKYFTIVAINALLVNLAGVFTCLITEKLLSRKAAVFSIFIITPLILLSPWNIVPYSDTFAILIPVLTFYIYISSKGWWKYGVIIFLSIIGYFIKPTAIIMLIAILITEAFKHKWRKPTLSKDFWLNALSIFSAIIFAFLIKYASLSYIGYHPIQGIQSAGFIHYLAMGQNDKNFGRYLNDDVLEMQEGTKYELHKFINRITSRSFGGQIEFFTKKLLVNYNDGMFAWGGEGNFYNQVPERDNPISNFLTSIFYTTGDNYAYYAQFAQIIWIFVLFGCIFMVRKKQSTNETVLELALIGVFMFVMLFEARARYLFCYTPIFVITSMVGYRYLYHSLSHRILKLRKTNQLSRKSTSD